MSKKRQKTQCPLLQCRKFIADLPRHMRLVHDWTKENSRFVKSKFGLRKSHTKKKVTTKYKDHHHPRHCPVDDCQAIVKRLPPHLKNIHRLKQGDEIYQHLLSSAKRASVIKPKKNFSLVNRDKKTFKTLGEALLKGPVLTDSSDEDDSTVELSSENLSTSSSSTESDEEEKEASREKRDGKPTLPNETEQTNYESSYLMKMFLDYLVSPDCGKRDEAASKQCAQQVKCILSVIDKENNITSLFDRLLIRDAFLKRYAEQKKHFDPRTIKSYLKSLHHFYNFILAEKFTGFNKEDIISMQANVTRWSSAYTGLVREVAWEKMDRHRKTRITPEEIVKFENSSTIRNIITVLGRLGEGKNYMITQDIFTTGRDFVAVEIFINNGHRPAPIRNMTLLNYREAKFDPDDDQYSMTVMKHKGTRPHGPAEIILTQTLYGWLKLYVDHLRSAVTNDNRDDSRVYVTWYGQGLKKGGTVSNCLNSIWKKAGFKKRICANKFRKCAVTVTRENAPPDSRVHDDVACLMRHEKATGDRWYLLEENEKKARRAAKVLPMLMRKCSSEPIAATSTITRPPSSTSSITHIYTEIESSNEKFGIDAPCDVSKKTDNKDSSKDCGIENTNKRKIWSEEETLEIKTLFEEEINDPKLTIEAVRKKIPSSTLLKDFTPKRVYDKIYSIRRYSKPDQVNAELPEEQEDLPTKIRRTLLQKNEEDRDYVPDAELPYEQDNVPTKARHSLLRKPEEDRDYIPDASLDIDNIDIMAPTRMSQRVNPISTGGGVFHPMPSKWLRTPQRNKLAP